MPILSNTIRRSSAGLATLLGHGRQGQDGGVGDQSSAAEMPVLDAIKSRITPIEDYHREFSDRIDGWLDPFTARRTSDLLDYQVRMGVKGPLYEVGVYKGKYLSVLLRSAILNGDRLFGIDVFNATTRAEFEDYFRTMMTDVPSAVEILEGLSTGWSALDLIRSFGAEVRFVSIDGSHEYEDVLWDLRVAGTIAAPAGIISADDFFNPECMGVNQAVNVFLSHSDDFKPLAYLLGKLLICRSGYVERYREELIRCIASDDSTPQAIGFTELYNSPHRPRVMPIFHGVPTIQIH